MAIANIKTNAQAKMDKTMFLKLNSAPFLKK